MSTILKYDILLVGDYMNNKGFTLVELLATIVILGLVMGIATYGVISAIDSSKKKSEEVFVSKFTSAIDSYLALNGDKLGEKSGGGSSSPDQNLVELNSFKLSDLADEDLIDRDKFINPRNKKDCYNGDATIRVFRDKQYVYYYYFDFKQLGVDENECVVDVKDGNNELVMNYKSNSKEVSSYVENNNDVDDNVSHVDVSSSTVADLHLGDYILYTPSSTFVKTDTYYTNDSVSKVISPNELKLWRIIKKNNSENTVDVVSVYVSSTKVPFNGKRGYQNFIWYLNFLASQYEKENYTVGSRYFGYSNQTERIKTVGNFSCSTGEGCHPDESRGGGDTGYLSDYELLRKSFGTVEAYDANGDKARYWVASRLYTYNSESGNYYLRLRYIDDLIRFKTLFSKNTSDKSASCSLRPIVVLRSDLPCVSGDGRSTNPCSIDGTIK